MRAFIPLAACSLALAGCLDVTATRIGPPSLDYDRSPVPPDRVAIYRFEDQVPGEYQEVALLHATGSESWSTEAEMYRKMREEAGRLGANAIILEPTVEPTFREKLTARKLNLDMGREGRAVAVYVPHADGGAEELGNGSEAVPDSADREGFYWIVLEDGSRESVLGAEPSSLGPVKVVRPDGTVAYLSAAKVRSITDRDGRDWTRWVLDQKRRLPLSTGAF